MQASLNRRAMRRRYGAQVKNGRLAGGRRAAAGPSLTLKVAVVLPILLFAVAAALSAVALVKAALSSGRKSS